MCTKRNFNYLVAKEMLYQGDEAHRKQIKTHIKAMRLTAICLNPIAAGELYVIRGFDNVFEGDISLKNHPVL